MHNARKSWNMGWREQDEFFSFISSTRFSSLVQSFHGAKACWYKCNLLDDDDREFVSSLLNMPELCLSSELLRHRDSCGKWRSRGWKQTCSKHVCFDSRGKFDSLPRDKWIYPVWSPDTLSWSQEHDILALPLIIFLVNKIIISHPSLSPTWRMHSPPRGHLSDRSPVFLPPKGKDTIMVRRHLPSLIWTQV